MVWALLHIIKHIVEQLNINLIFAEKMEAAGVNADHQLEFLIQERNSTWRNSCLQPTLSVCSKFVYLCNHKWHLSLTILYVALSTYLHVQSKLDKIQVYHTKYIFFLHIRAPNIIKFKFGGYISFAAFQKSRGCLELWKDALEILHQQLNKN